MPCNSQHHRSPSLVSCIRPAPAAQQWRVAHFIRPAPFCNAVHTMGGYLWWPPMEQLGLPEKATAHTLQALRALQKAVVGMHTS